MSKAPFILLVAMGFHSALEGIALGIISSTTGFYFFGGAIFAHKWAEAIGLGLRFLKQKIPTCTAQVCLIIFALLTPLGIMAGLYLIGHADRKSQGILFAVSAGAFIYFAIVEIIGEEFTASKHRWTKFIFLLVGLAVMIGIKFLEGDSHEH